MVLHNRFIGCQGVIQGYCWGYVKGFRGSMGFDEGQGMRFGVLLEGYVVV